MTEEGRAVKAAFPAGLRPGRRLEEQTSGGFTGPKSDGEAREIDDT